MSSAFADAARTVCATASQVASPLRIEPQAAPAGSLTADDEAALRSLRGIIGTALSSVDSESWRGEAEAHCDDFTLLRFVRSRTDSVNSAFEMFRDAMSWRSSNRINHLFVELHPKAPEPSKRQRLARAHYFGGFGGIDKSGSPYFVLRVGQADFAAFARDPELAQLMCDADAVNMEHIFRTVRCGSAATGRFVRAMVVVDIAGFSLSALRHIGLIKAVMKVGPNVFPEGASKVLLVNAPRIFAAAWAVVSPLLPQRSRDKVSIYSASATSAALLELIDSNELPKFLGGSQPEAESLIARAERVPDGTRAAIELS